MEQRTSGVARATIIGHVGQDPRVARFEQGGAAANFSLAVSHAVKRPDGTVESKTDWYNVVARGSGICDIVEKVVKKGQLVWVEGQLERKSGCGPVCAANALSEKDFKDKQGVERKQYSVKVYARENFKILRFPDGPGGPGGPGQEHGEKDVFGGDKETGQVYD